jgi:hypothetical protein
MITTALFSKLFNHDYNLEDFATEVLAGVLRSDQTLLDNFVNELLGIKGEHFVLETQKNYGDLTVDMVFTNEKTLCFLENKIDAWVKEQVGQLEKCGAFLLTQQPSLKVYLRYCSKYYDTQPIKGINFAQFRWAEVCQFLTNYLKNPLVKAFIDFIEEQDMKGITTLTTEDLFAMSSLNETIKKLDECLDSVAAEFTMLFGYPSRGAPKERSERLKILVQFNSYRMMKQDILSGGGGWSEITICFNFEKITHPNTTLAIWFWCDKSHSQYELLKEQFYKNKHIFSINTGFLYEERPIGLRILIQKPLNEFHSEANPLQAIHDWLIETLWIFRKFVDKTPQISWHIPPRIYGI